MPHCLLLKITFTELEICFFDPWELSQDWRSDFAYAPQTSMLYVRIGEIIASKILFARNGGSLLKSDEAG